MNAEQIRKRSAETQQTLIAQMESLASRGTSPTPADAIVLVAKILIWGVSFIPEIAAQLAEANARDTAAEVRMKAMKEFVEALQAEMAARPQVVVPGIVPKQR